MSFEVGGEDWGWQSGEGKANLSNIPAGANKVACGLRLVASLNKDQVQVGKGGLVGDQHNLWSIYRGRL